MIPHSTIALTRDLLLLSVTLSIYIPYEPVGWPSLSDPIPWWLQASDRWLPSCNDRSLDNSMVLWWRKLAPASCAQQIGRGTKLLGTSWNRVLYWGSPYHLLEQCPHPSIDEVGRRVCHVSSVVLFASWPLGPKLPYCYVLPVVLWSSVCWNWGNTFNNAKNKIHETHFQSLSHIVWTEVFGKFSCD